MHDARQKEDKGGQQHGNGADSDDFKANILLRALHLLRGIRAAFEFASGQSHGITDDAPTANDADNAGHSNTADADAARIILKNLFGTHLPYTLHNRGIPKVKHRVMIE